MALLIVKPEHFSQAKLLFTYTDIIATVQGQQHLGAALGSLIFAEK